MSKTSRNALARRKRSSPSGGVHAAHATDDGAYAFAGVIADRIVSTPAGDLHVSRHQTRLHDERQISLIMASFDRFGLINPIIADETGEILAGAARFEAARRLNIALLPVVQVAHLSADEKRAYRIADNRIAELAGWDTKALAIEFEHLIEIEFDPNTIGFSTPEIDIVLSGEAASDNDDLDDALPERSGPPVARPGDLYFLGKHRLLCGNSMEPSSYALLMDGKLARLVLSDPPYNCAVDGFVGGLGQVKHREFAMAAGEMTDAEFTTFLERYFANSIEHLVDGGLCYTFMDWRQQLPLLSAAKTVGLVQINLCVWNKLTGGMGSLYRSQHELCAIHKKGSAPHRNMVELGRHGRYRTNVWDHQGMAGFSRDRGDLLKVHPTVKPWALLADAIKDCTAHGEVILDPFLGSGSTLIAAEKSGRVCHGIELDPIYCDAIVARYQALTGKSAIHSATNKTFAELAEERGSSPDVPADTIGTPAASAIKAVDAMAEAGHV